MVELIKGLAQVRDALSLIAFLSLVALVAFRTKTVPELFFGLLRDKLTRQEFSKLLGRAMTLTTVGFVLLVALAGLSQYLHSQTQPNALTVTDLRRELAIEKASEDQKIRAEAQYRQAMDWLRERDFNRAIASLQDSIKAVPTLTAQEMLTYLYRQQHDYSSAQTVWEAAEKTARSRGDAIALARLDNSTVPPTLPDVEGEHDLIGAKTPLPDGGNNYESAATIPPGLYECVTDACSGSWYKVSLRTGQRLRIKFRKPPSWSLTGVALYGVNGESLDQKGAPPGSARGNVGGEAKIDQIDWVAKASGWHYLRVVADKESVYLIQIL
ncbi:tetratricopeptide repeat protein [Bradyrhizobium sp.]